MRVAREAQEQARLLSPRDAADADSLFAHVEGLTVHYKLRRPPSSSSAGGSGGGGRGGGGGGGGGGVVVSCAHGFGANTYSFDRAVLQPLATALGATVVAHDSPGFGLTERVADLSKYTPAHNAKIVRAMLGVAEAEGGRGRCRRIIVGHSMAGGLLRTCTRKMLNRGRTESARLFEH